MKNPILVVSLVLLFCFTFGCQNKAEKAELEKFRVQAKLEEQNKEIVIKWFDSINKGDFDALRELVAPKYLLYSPSRSTEPQSSGDYIELIKTFRKTFPDITWKILEFIPEGDRVIIRYLSRGTHKGEFAGIPATGNQIEYGGTAIYRIENGKVVEEMVDNDGMGIFSQLGMELKPKQVKK